MAPFFSPAWYGGCMLEKVPQCYYIKGGRKSKKNVKVLCGC